MAEPRCMTCYSHLKRDEPGPLCAECDETVRNPRVAAHLFAHKAGLNDAWLDEKQRSRTRWFRRKAAR